MGGKARLKHALVQAWDEAKEDAVRQQVHPLLFRGRRQTRNSGGGGSSGGDGRSSGSGVEEGDGGGVEEGDGGGVEGGDGGGVEEGDGGGVEEGDGGGVEGGMVPPRRVAGGGSGQVAAAVVVGFRVWPARVAISCGGADRDLVFVGSANDVESVGRLLAPGGVVVVGVQTVDEIAMADEYLHREGIDVCGVSGDVVVRLGCRRGVCGANACAHRLYCRALSV